MTELGVVNIEDGTRLILAQLENGSFASGLRLSPDGKQLLWVAHVVSPNSPLQVQLQLTSITDTQSQTLAILGEGVEYRHQATWSPNGKLIAAIKIEDVFQGKERANNIVLIDVATNAETPVTHFSDRQLSHLLWQPNSQNISFSLLQQRSDKFWGNEAGYSEIWAVDIHKAQPYPLAGPAVVDAPFTLLP